MTDTTDSEQRPEGTDPPMSDTQTEPETVEPTYTIDSPPPPPTAEEVAARYAAQRQADAARENAEREEADAAKYDRDSRLSALAERIARNIKVVDGAELPPEEEGWETVDELQARNRRDIWWASIKEGSFQTKATYRIEDIEEVEARKVLARYVNQLGPEMVRLNCVVSGTTGSGKTVSAIAAGHAAVSRGMTVRIIEHRRYIAQLQPGGLPHGVATKDALLARYRRLTDLLIIDDFGSDMDSTRATTEFVAAETKSLVGDRAGAGLPTIYTTNLSSNEVRLMFGDRTHSRIGESAIGVKILGQDRRDPLKW